VISGRATNTFGDQRCWDQQGGGAASHEKSSSKYILPFTLPVDTRALPVASAYGSLALKKFMGREYMGQNDAPLLRWWTPAREA